jgi:predicted double-glycine peptidase
MPGAGHPVERPSGTRPIRTFGSTGVGPSVVVQRAMRADLDARRSPTVPPTRPRPEATAAPLQPSGRVGPGRLVGPASLATAIGAGLVLAAVLVADPMSLVRLLARGQAVRAGAEILGREGLTLQGGLHDCGPAALANLAASLGREAPALDSLARLADTRPSGTRLSGLVRAAAALDLPLAAWSGPSTSDLSLPVPSIAWVWRSHFVTVVSRDGAGRLEILDPLVGRYRMSPADFRRIWSGEVLLVVQEATPLVATSVAALLPPAGGFHATSPFGSAHPDPGRRLRDTPAPNAP